MLELQRLLTASPASLPRRVIIDVGGILRHVLETSPQSWPMPELLDMSRRARRQILWVVAPPSVPGLVTPDLLSRAATGLADAGVGHLVLSATDSLASMLMRTPPATPTTVVTAGLDERPYELHLLDRGVTAMLDVGTGIVWNYERALKFGEPALLPEVAAVAGAEPGEAPPGGRGARRLHGRVLELLAGGPASLPAPVRAAIDNRHLRAKELRGGSGMPDSGAHEVARWLARGVATDTVYVTARAERGADGTFKFNEIGIDIGGHVQRAHGEDAAVALLERTVAAHPMRWFAPRALDLLAAMVDANLPLPSAIVDPAIVAYAIRPGVEKVDLPEVAPMAAVLPGAVRAWASDMTRATPAPRSLGFLLDVLPDLDAELRRTSSEAGIADLVETDLALTLPVLARIERAGAWVDTPGSWGALRVDVEQRAITYEAVAKALAGINDVYSDSLKVLCAAVKKKHGTKAIPAPYWHPSLNAKEELARLVHLRVPEAIAVKEARRLGGTVLRRVRCLEHAAGGRLRGMSVPQSSGRWALRDVDLQNIQRRGAEGKTIRSGMRGPPGEVLVGADQNGFDVRLLADLSGDAELLAAAANKDVHGAIATRLSSIAGVAVSREQAKRAVIAIMYGQGKDGFFRKEAAIPIAAAQSLYSHTESLLTGVATWRRQVHFALNKNRHARTRSGWILLPETSRNLPAQRRSVFNGLVQGLGADIQRWVLRRLAQVLPPEARIVTQTHDDIVIACPLPMAIHVEELLVTAMTHDVMTMTRLLQRGVPLVAIPKRGVTWGDLV